MNEMNGTRTICLCCGKEWAIAEVAEDDGKRFIRRGCLIGACPACGGTRPERLAEDERRRLDTFSGLAAACGEDLEAFGWFLEVFKVI
ncbi:hypothetical protein [Tautonia sociabilis]|uniref:Uncharacterized protein n=1 Tax=Tautonia sociabilis TaxID=2080755 RepID=A0A432MIF1_9BACT|nr:hypothetical protein [Tautonia sociabilis]RUL86985.1 hypothetical protein TsocGM_14405 [Tautonia sociabilis]